MYVLWLAKPEIEVTWETADFLSPAVIEEFEKGILSEVVTLLAVQMSFICRQQAS